MTVNIKLEATELKAMTQDIRFVLAAIENKSFKIGDFQVDIPSDDESQKLYVLLKGEYARLQRVEILLESYSKTINIEALTMIDMAKKKYIPACLTYSKELADAIAVKKSIDVCSCVEKDLVKKVTDETEKAYDAVQKLEEVTAVAAAKTCMQEMANAYRDTVLPVMDELRKAVDALEVLLPSTMWPVPAYSEMIFNV